MHFSDIQFSRFSTQLNNISPLLLKNSISMTDALRACIGPPHPASISHSNAQRSL